MEKFLMEYIVFGTTYGFSSTEATDEEERFINQFYRADFGKKTYIHKRYNGKVYYTHTIYADKQKSFCDSKGRPGAFLGVTIAFDRKYCRDFEKINRVFENIYQNFIQKGYIKETNGSRRFMISDFKTYAQDIDTAVINAVRSQDLTSADLENFNFIDIKGTYYCHPSDMKTLNKVLMEMPYNIAISDKYPTKEMIRSKKINRK